jgi:ubiquinone/menaquinone biosynthesis C-methylase UbiE
MEVVAMEKIEPYKGIAGIYEEIRPSYPEKLIKDIIIKTKIKPEDRLLEIGAGTGKATVQFAEKGFCIRAIEIGEDMVDILKDKCSVYPEVTVDVSSFEVWNSSGDHKYDMIYCAQAFHWIDKNIKYKKCYELLKDDGYLALFWYNPVIEKLPITKEIDTKISEIIKKYFTVKDTDKNEGRPERRSHDGVSGNDERKAEIDVSGVFTLTEKIEYTEEIHNNPRQYLLAMKSVPAFASILDSMDTDTIEKMDNEIIELINHYEGYVTTQFQFTLYLCKKILELN